MRKKRVLVWAYLNKNLGDDLFIKILSERYPEIDIYIINAEKKNLEPFEGTNVKNISYKETIRKLKNFDAFIDIGGSIFQFDTSTLGNLKKKILLSGMLRIVNKPSFIIGSNFGPYNKKISIIATKLYFKIAKDVCLRDSTSYEIFKAMKNVRMAPDIVFSMKNTSENRKKEMTVGISMIDLSDRKKLKNNNQIYANKMIDLSNKLIELGYKVSLVSFCSSEGDTLILDNIYKKINRKDKVEKLYYNGKINEFLNKFCDLNSMVSCRFHSFILSQIYNQSTYPIIYSDKLVNVLNDIGLDKEYCYIENIDKLNIDRVINILESDNKVNIDKIANDANRQFTELDIFINR